MLLLLTLVVFWLCGLEMAQIFRPGPPPAIINLCKTPFSHTTRPIPVIFPLPSGASSQPPPPGAPSPGTPSPGAPSPGAPPPPLPTGVLAPAPPLEHTAISTVITHDYGQTQASGVVKFNPTLGPIPVSLSHPPTVLPLLPGVPASPPPSPDTPTSAPLPPGVPQCPLSNVLLPPMLSSTLHNSQTPSTRQQSQMSSSHQHSQTSSSHQHPICPLHPLDTMTCPLTKFLPSA